jgi:spore coat protein A, manganese oxidase
MHSEHRVGKGVVVLVALAALLTLTFSGVAAAAPVPGGSLDPTTITKYVTPLVIPPAMPETGPNYYEISMQQFQQMILPAGFPASTVWSYGALGHPETLNYPAFTIEARVNQPTRVKWINGLVDAHGNYLPHLFAVDQTLHWANPNKSPEPSSMGPGKTDSKGSDPTPYTGPVPIVTHVHGAHVTPESDGYPEAWWLPAANNIPSGYATRGSHWGQIAGVPAQDGAATFQYPNDQAAATIWYHDHALGITRLNVAAGPAGFYLLRGGANDVAAGVLPGPAPQLGDAPGTKYYEIPIAVQDRSFNTDGSLFYPSNRAFFEELNVPTTVPYLNIPFIPSPAIQGLSDVAAIWNPEFFGNTMVVNGKTWPVLEVEPRRYRLRWLNGCDSRTLILEADKPLTFWQIGSDQGFLAQPVALQELLMAPAERADVIVDFSAYAPGETITLLNTGPDAPFNGGGQDPADPDTTGQVMQFKVVALTAPDTSADPATLTLPAAAPLGAASRTEYLSLNELDSSTVKVVTDSEGNIVFDLNGDPFGPTAALLGTYDPITKESTPLTWMDGITENPVLGSTEIWEIHNNTMDAHPIHLHLVQFEVVNREDAQGTVSPPQPWETGYKDTVLVYPDGITRVKATFDIAGLYVWHCHIISHEDNEMMRAYQVLLPAPSFPDVPPTHPFHAAITYLAQRGIVSGYTNGLFGVDDALARTQIAKMTVVAFAKQGLPVPVVPTFPDVPNDGAPYPYPFVEQAAAAGFVTGYTDGTFGPYDLLTRVQLVRILMRAAGDTLSDPPPGYDPGFTDISPADMAVVAKAKYHGIIDGKTSTTFDPYGTATRGHVAEMLYKILTMQTIPM